MNIDILISIIVPVYNVEKWIHRCLLSVCNQTYTNIECIIVNDATPDNSMVIVDEVLKSYNGNVKFKVINHEMNRGLSAARNSGVRAATGDYLFFLDSDDELYSIETVNSVCLWLQQYAKVDFVLGGCFVVGGPPLIQTIKGYYEEKDILNSFLERKWAVIACAKFIRRSFFIEKRLWFEEGILHEDIIFSFRLAVFASSMIAMEEDVYKYYIHRDSITSQMRYKNYKDYLYAMKSNYHLISEKKNVNKKIISSFFIQGLFGFFCSIVHNKRISNLERNTLLDQYQKDVKDMDLDRPIGLKASIKYMLFQMNPFLLKYIIIKLRIGANG